MLETLKKLIRDEDGSEGVEYALIAALIVVGAVVTIKSTGTKVIARWTSISSST